MRQTTQNKLKSKNGMTMAEVLVVVAIIMILGSVAFIAILNYQRSMGQLERDAIAKELFIAAQNHLTSTEAGLGMITENKAGNVENETSAGGVYYIVYNHGEFLNNKGEFIYNQMLPFGSIDETIRSGGNYVIRYQPSIGKVLDVFYCSENDNPEKFNHLFFDDGETYDSMLACGGNEEDNETVKKEKKAHRRDYLEGSILGWYGGEDLEALGYDLESPNIKIYNGNKLYVETTDTNYSTGSGIVMQLIVTGVSSNAVKSIKPDKTQRTTSTSGTASVTTSVNTFILDDITTGKIGYPDKHFASKFNPNEVSDNGNGVNFIPGENLSIQAIEYSSTKLANVAKSGIGVTNSLFDDIGGETDNDTASSIRGIPEDEMQEPTTIQNVGEIIPDTAYISTIRHLENLDKEVSNLDAYDGDGSPGNENKLQISKAIQTKDLDWNAFIGNDSADQSSANGINNNGDNLLQALEDDGIGNNGADNDNNGAGNDNNTPTITTEHINSDAVASNTVCYSNAFGDNSYAPMNPTDSNCYKPVKLEDGFDYNGKSKDSDNEDLNVIHSINNIKVAGNGSANAGLLATVSQCSIRNIELIGFDITSKSASIGNTTVSNAGALIGSASRSTIENVLVRDGENVKSSINAEGNAGGLIGSAANSTINYCAASATVGDKETKPDNAGGLIGAASDCTVTACYSGGHTEDGEYYKGHQNRTRKRDAERIFNVTAATTAGGLIGNAGNSTILYSYSTCSASGVTTGGFVGFTSGTIKHCYATGLVNTQYISDNNDHDTNNKAGAFIGALSNGTSVEKCNYYSMVNEVRKGTNDNSTLDHYLGAVGDRDYDNGGNIAPFDNNVKDYNAFEGAWNPASPYDATLKALYYGGENNKSTQNEAIYDNKYSLKTITEMNGCPKPAECDSWDECDYFVKTHYGDWPVPETFVINE